ncbi:MAG TPA: TolC family protein, partial [Acidobacteriota bacterium]|nr:TolC family protein [Acidobacteriota bacterium]
GSLETRDALAQLDAARAQWEASAGVVEQATRAYEIAEVRYREGISTQTELSDARLLLQNLDAMHSRLEIERRDWRRRAVVLAINVDLALRQYHDDERRRTARLLLRKVRCRLRRPRELLRRRRVGCCRLLRRAGDEPLSLRRRAGLRRERFWRHRLRRG